MDMTRPRASTLVMAAAFSGALVLSGCQQVLPFVIQSPPKFDQKTIDALTTTQQDADALFTTLSATTGCAYSANSAQFDVVDADLAALVKEAGAMANNSFTLNGSTSLQQGFDKFRAAAASTPAGCPPPGLAQDKKSSFDAAVASLAAYENAKPKG